MPHHFSADDIEPQPQTASGRSGSGRGSGHGSGRGPRTAAGVLDELPEPPERTRMGTLMDRIRGVLARKRRPEKPR
jgi:hypothetical protein